MYLWTINQSISPPLLLLPSKSTKQVFSMHGNYWYYSEARQYYKFEERSGYCGAKKIIP